MGLSPLSCKEAEAGLSGTLVASLSGLLRRLLFESSLRLDELVATESVLLALGLQSDSSDGGLTKAGLRTRGGEPAGEIAGESAGEARGVSSLVSRKGGGTSGLNAVLGETRVVEGAGA